MKTPVVAAALALLVLGSASPSAAQSGLVRVYNRTPISVTVYVLNVDFFGNRSWQPLRDVAPNSYLDLPNVPAGIMVGAQERKTGRQWRPARVEYTSGRPIFEYIVTR